jgi:hypothetical protein
LNKASGGPQIYTAANDTQLITLTNIIAGASYTTANECFNYFAGQSDKMVVNRDYEPIVTDGLILNLDAGFTPSYPCNGTNWYDLSSSVNNSSLINGPSYSSTNGGCIVLDGSNDTIDTPISLNSLPALSNFSIDCWVKIPSYPTAASPNFYGNTTRQGVLVGATYYCGTALFWTGNNLGNSFSVFSYIRGADAYRVTSSYSVTSLNTYYYFTLVNNYSNSTFYLYVNGSLYSSANGPTQEYNSGLTPTAGNIGISKPQVDGGGEQVYSYLNCTISSSKIYNIALSSAQVLQNFNAQKSRFGL